MTISIAMCTYNGSQFLEEQLLSIRAQTEPPFELVVCDDGSSDETVAMVERFRDSVPFPVRLYQNAVNLGSTRNFEQAIRLCAGEFIALCDQDDVWAPEKLAVMASRLQADQNLAGVFCNAALIDGNGKPLQGSLWQRSRFTRRKQERFTKVHAPYALIDRDTVTGATLMFRSQYVSQIMPIPAEWIHDGWIALVLASMAEIQPVPSCLMWYRLHGRQQVGVTKVPWYSHLSTRKDVALAAHARTALRFELMEEKLEALGADMGTLLHVRRKAVFLRGRHADLQKSRASRFIPIARKLHDYIRFEKGLMSMLRDLAY